MKYGAVIVAAGRGGRFGGDLPKAFVLLAGKPLYRYSLEIFKAHPGISEIILVIPPDYEMIQKQRLPFGLKVVIGGAARQDSVLNGVNALSADIDAVLVHDAARPFLTSEIIDRLLAALERGKEGIAAVPVTDTIKQGEGTKVVKTVNRRNLWRAQTPQAFRVETLQKALRCSEEGGWVGTDEASLVERCGGEVELIQGDSLNIKITTPQDLLFAESVLKSRS